MITFIAFVLTILGCVNWLMIGLLQYDYIAGLFGFQASMFSRIVYIIFGVAAAYLVIRVIVNKGTFKVWEKKKGKRATLNQEQANQQEQSAQIQPAYANVEAGQEQIPQQQEVSEQKPPKKKKWWQFWRGNVSSSKKKSKKSPNTPQENQTNSPEKNMSPVDIDISLNTTPEHFNEQPTLEKQPSQDNLFDEL